MAGARGRSGADGRRGGVIYEFLPRGSYIKVSAIDEHTGTEVSIVGDARVSQADLQRIALRKLDKVMSEQPQKRR